MDVRDFAAVAPTGLSSIIYATVQCAFHLSLLRRREPPPLPEGAPRVSIVKPIAGLDDDLADNLASFASLDYRRLKGRYYREAGRAPQASWSRPSW